jgi:hypothetical protein
MAKLPNDGADTLSDLRTDVESATKRSLCENIETDQGANSNSAALSVAPSTVRSFVNSPARDYSDSDTEGPNNAATFLPSPIDMMKVRYTIEHDKVDENKLLVADKKTLPRTKEYYNLWQARYESLLKEVKSNLIRYTVRANRRHRVPV